MSPEKMRRNLLFAASRAINDSAFAARKKLVDTLPEHFTVRNTWTSRGFRVVRSSRQNLVAKVGNTRSYLPGQVKGERRRDKAVPTRAVRKRRQQRVGRSRWPSRVLEKPGHFVVQARKAHLPGRLSQHRSRNERLVFRRMGGKRRSKLRLLWVIPDAIRLRPRYPFARIVQRTHRRVYPVQFRKRVAEALATAR